jgi:hypothetical protein
MSADGSNDSGKPVTDGKSEDGISAKRDFDCLI